MQDSVNRLKSLVDNKELDSCYRGNWARFKELGWDTATIVMHGKYKESSVGKI